MSTESAVDLAKKYITLQREFNEFNKANRAEATATLKALNSHAPFFSLECWSDSKTDDFGGCGEKEMLIAMFFNKDDADKYTQELMAEIRRRGVQGEPIIELHVSEHKIITSNASWRAARFGVSIDEGYTVCCRYMYR